jgi:hypothetical protein
VTAAYRNEALYRENWYAKNAVNKKKRARELVGRQAGSNAALFRIVELLEFFDGSQLNEFKTVHRSYIYRYHARFRFFGGVSARRRDA